MSARIQIGLCLAVSLTLIAVLMALTYDALPVVAVLIGALWLFDILMPATGNSGD